MVDDAVIELLGFVFVALVVATIAGAALRLRYGATDTIKNFQSRTFAWWIMVAILTIAILAGRAVTLALYAGLSAVALYEFLYPRLREKPWSPALFAAFAIIIPVQYALIWTGSYGLFTVFIPVYGFLMMPILVVIQGRTAGFLREVSELQWGIMLAIFSLSHVPALLLLDIPGYEGRSILLLAFLVLVVQASDVLQYLWGKALGRHKLAPSVSPSKTVEGLVGGVASACLVGAFFASLTPFTRSEALLISLLVSIMGFFGGFVLSAIKRDRHVKDWGSLIPGHGGILDRVDSLIFAAPVYFHFVRYWSSA